MAKNKSDTNNDECPNKTSIFEVIYMSIFFILIVGCYVYVYNSNGKTTEGFNKTTKELNSIKEKNLKLESQVLVQDTNVKNILSTMTLNRKYYDDFMKDIATDYKEGMKELRADVKAILKSLPRCDAPN